MVGMLNKFATCPSGGTLWLPVEVLSSFATIDDDDDVVKRKVFLCPTVGTKCFYQI